MRLALAGDEFGAAQVDHLGGDGDGDLLGVLGLYLLTYHGDGAPFNFGDALVLIGVAFWSLHILCVDRFVEWSTPSWALPSCP